MDPSQFGPRAPGQAVSVPGRGYYAFIPDPLPPDLQWTDELVKALSEADRAIGELAGLGRTVANPALLIQPFVRREAVLSSRIEGTQASINDLYQYELDQLSSLPRPSDAREVYNYVQALEYGLDRLKTLPLSLRLIREIHARLMAGVRGDVQTPGEFRRTQNWIGAPGAYLADATFVPPPPDAMREALNRFEAFLHGASELPSLVQLGLIHYQFETIHPFLDGNGRVGRLLITLLLSAWQLLPQPLLYLSAYFEVHRDQYYNHLLAVSQSGAWAAWLSFFLKAVRVQSTDAIVRANRLLALHDQYHQRFQNQRGSSRLLQAIDYLFQRPILSIAHLAEAMGVPVVSANRYVATLEKQGVLTEITGQTRNRRYRADKVLEAINRPVEDSTP